MASCHQLTAIYVDLNRLKQQIMIEHV